MAQLSLAVSILQIVNSVSHVSASAFLQWCAALGLEPTQPQRDPEPPGFPHYDAAHSFAFKTDDRAAATFDLLAYRECIIQVRLSVHYRRALLGLLPSKTRRARPRGPADSCGPLWAAPSDAFHAGHTDIWGR